LGSGFFAQTRTHNKNTQKKSKLKNAKYRAQNKKIRIKTTKHKVQQSMPHSNKIGNSSTDRRNKYVSMLISWHHF
jgi:hypothetical protein